jgi:hypothetical protein
MITEDYCSYEIAKLLKEKGFNTPCMGRYSIRSKNFHLDCTKTCTNGGLFECAAPSQAMTMAWLREVHNIIIVIEPHMYDYINEKTSSYVTSLWQGDNYYENITSKDYPTYEEAVEATLKYVLEKQL